MYLQLGECIRNNRKRLNWTQEQLADRLGVSGQAVSRWENGVSYPDMELLPVLTKLFAITADELLGLTEPAEKLSEEALGGLVRKAIETGDPEQVVPVMRMIRFEYLQELYTCTHYFQNIQPDSPLAKSPVFLEELRLLFHSYLDQGLQYGCKHQMIHVLARLEDEEHFQELLSKYSVTASWDMTVTGLHLIRSDANEDRDTYRLLAEEKKLWYMHQFLQTQCPALVNTRKVKHSEWEKDLPPGDPRYWREVSERKLRLLHLFNSMETDPVYPVSGNGREDIWVETRLHIGLPYAAQLAAVGETERALTVLEDCAGLVEQVFAFAGGAEAYSKGYFPEKCPSIPCFAPELSHIRGYKAPIWDRADRERTRIVAVDIRIHSCVDRRGSLNLDFCGFIQNCFHGWLTETFYPRDNFRSSWFDSIRAHPRYKAVAERMRICEQGGE